MKIITYLFCFFVLHLQANAQETAQVTNDPVIIGLTETPPFVMQENGKYTGLSITSWNLVNEKLGFDYEYRIFPDLNSLLLAVEQEEVDFSINPITVTDKRMERMDFSQPYFISHTAIARRTGSKVWSYLSNMVSWNFISAILALTGIIFVFGLLVWIFEHKSNQEEFGTGIRGILQGFWWSAVTMTTVGYGDKSPKTFGGRLIGLIWMFLAIIMISSLTAGIASSLTVQNIQDEINSIQDLERFDVATVKSSSSLELLEQYAIKADLVTNAEEGLNRLLNKETSVFVYDQPILNYLIENKELTDKIEVLPRTLKKDYFSYSFPNDSPLVKKIDPVLMGILQTMEWNSAIKNYR